MTEKQLQQAVVACARLLGWRVYHTYDSRRSEPGFPDLCMARNGFVIFAELKTAAGKLRPGQRDWLLDLTPTFAGGSQNPTHQVCVWYPENWLSGDIEVVLRRSHRGDEVFAGLMPEDMPSTEGKGSS